MTQDKPRATELMRELVAPDVAAGLLRRLVDLMEAGDVRLTDFKNNIWTKNGSISISWEEKP